MKPIYKIATTAIHLTGDISRKTPDICLISDEDTDNYIGCWVIGFGFINVKFPKATTRDLTSEEIEKYHGQPVWIGNGYGGAINIKGEDFLRHVTAVRQMDSNIHTGTLIAPIKVGSSIIMITDDSKTWCSSKILKIEDDRVETLNSIYFVTYDEAI